MFVGYARVSTDNQSLDSQRDALKEIGYEQIFQVQMSGVEMKRPNLV